MLQRNRSYRSNTKSGCILGKWEAHHILCNHAVVGRQIDKNKAFVEDCLWITPWDLNDAHNMIGLPKNVQYRASDGKIPVNLPSHQVDHNTAGGYTEECKYYLKKHIWSTLNDRRKHHETNAKAIDAALRTGSDYFRGELIRRGSRKKGTAFCWGHRFSDPPASATATEKSNYKWEKKWYYPFSMATEARVNQRRPGVRWDLLRSILRKIS